MERKEQSVHSITNFLEKLLKVFNNGESRVDIKIAPKDLPEVLTLEAARELLSTLKNPSPEGFKEAIIKKDETKQKARSFFRYKKEPAKFSRKAASLFILLAMMSGYLASCSPGIEINANDPDPDPDEAPAAEIVPTLMQEENQVDEFAKTETVEAEEIITEEEQIDLSGITGEIAETPLTEALSSPTKWSDMEIQNNSNSENNRSVIYSLAPNDLEVIEKSLEDKMGGPGNWSFLYCLTDKRWTVVIRDNETGEIKYAADKDTELPFAQLAPFGVEEESDYKIVENPIDNGVDQVLAASKDGFFFTIMALDENGKPISWMNLKTGQMEEINLPDNLPAGWQFGGDKNHIVDVNGKPLFVYVSKTVIETEAAVATETAEAEVEEGAEKETAKDDEGMEWIREFRETLEIDNYKNNLLTMEDFEKGGSVDRWFEYIEPKIIAGIDFEKIENKQFTTSDAYLVYLTTSNNEIKFDNEKTNPFIRDFDFFGELVVGNNHYIFMPLILIDKQNKNVYFVKLALPLQKDGHSFSEEEINDLLEIWKNEMNISPIGLHGQSFYAQESDPLFDPLMGEMREKN